MLFGHMRFADSNAGTLYQGDALTLARRRRLAGRWLRDRGIQAHAKRPAAVKHARMWSPGCAPLSMSLQPNVQTLVADVEVERVGQHGHVATAGHPRDG